MYANEVLDSGFCVQKVCGSAQCRLFAYYATTSSMAQLEMSTSVEAGIQSRCRAYLVFVHLTIVLVPFADQRLGRRTINGASNEYG